jgi:5'(3')-deoxyribonucleotidase
MRKLLYVDMDNVLVDFLSGVARIDPALARRYEGRLDEVPGIFALMEPLPGAVEGFQTLARHFDAYVLSTAPWENPSAWSDKLLWVKRHLGKSAYKRLVLTHHKDLNVGDFLVDDRTKNGVERFRGEHVHFGTERFPDWASVVDYLLARA